MAIVTSSVGGRWRMQAVQLTAVLLVFLGCGRARSQSLGVVYVTPQNYSLEHQRGDIEGLYCDLPSNHNPYACEHDYWVAYSQSLTPPMSMGICGSCLQLRPRGRTFPTRLILNCKRGNYGKYRNSNIYTSRGRKSAGSRLEITNNDGGASIIGCILDRKVATGLDLDIPGFNTLDTDGQGNFNGHMFCTVEFVSCSES